VNERRKSGSPDRAKSLLDLDQLALRRRQVTHDVLIVGQRVAVAISNCVSFTLCGSMFMRARLKPAMFFSCRQSSSPCRAQSK
jgi:hypothetical protein